VEEAEAKMSEFLADYMSRIEAVGGGRMDAVDSGNVSRD